MMEEEIKKAVKGKGSRFLVMGNTMIDYDLAVMKVFQFNYNNPDFVNQEVMRYTLPELKWALLRRTELNPLSICLYPSIVSPSNMDKILSDLCKDDGELLNRILTPTGTYNLISMLSIVSGFDVTVLCTDEEEKNVIERFHRSKNFKYILESDLEEPINMDFYDCIVIKDIRDAITSFQLEKKVIFVQNYEFNISRESDGSPLPRVDVSFQLLKHKNNVMLMEVYDHKGLKSPISKHDKNTTQQEET
jgi:hypothetical protein